MVRSGYGKHSTVATGSDSGDQVSVNAWNANINDAGMLGFTPSTKTISSGAITPVDTVTVVAAEAGTTDDLDFITYSETNANDILYLFADSGDTITVRNNQSPGAGQSAIITTSAASVTLSETVPLVLQRRSTTFYQIIENSISSVTAGSTTTFTNKSIDLTDNTLTGTSAELATAISDETGSGALVFGTSPTLVTPALGTPASGVATNITGLPIVAGTTGTLSVARGGTGVTTSTGTGNTVLSTSPTLVTPVLGTPSSGTLTSCTGLPLTTGVTGTLPVANGGTGVTTSTGSGANALATSPTFVTPALGTPASGVLTNATGLPPAGVVGTAAILGANTFTELQTIHNSTLNNGNLLKIIGQTGGTFDGIHVINDHTNSGLRGSGIKLQRTDTDGTTVLEQGFLKTESISGDIDSGKLILQTSLNNTLVDGLTIDQNQNTSLNGNNLIDIQNVVHDLSTTTVALDFTADQLQEITVSATATFTCSAYTVGSSKTIKILDSGSGQTLAFPASWKFVGAKPTAIAASKTAILTLTCFTTAESGVVAAYAVEE